MLSAVIPVLNEENTLPLVLANLRQINKLTSAFFILNGCTDSSGGYQKIQNRLPENHYFLSRDVGL